MRGVKLRTWARAKGLSDSDYVVLLDLSNGNTKSKWRRAKELKELLEKEGFKTNKGNMGDKDFSLIMSGLSKDS